MARLFRKAAILVAAVVMTAGSALAQDTLRDRSPTGRSHVPGIADIDSVSVAPLSTTPLGVKQGTGAAGATTVASKEATALEKAQNALRAKEGRLALAWSATLAAEAEAGAAKAAAGVCTFTSTQKAQAPGAANVYWSAPTRRMDGAFQAQNLLPSFVVSEWRAGRSDVDPATGKCRQPGPACEAFVRMMASEHRSVGCAVRTCPTQAQVYICRYGK